MTDLHDLCKFSERPISEKYVDQLKYYLKAGIPATYTIEEAYNYNNGIEEEPPTTTTPLHLIFTHFPSDASDEETRVVNEMVTKLFEFGAGWCLTDINNETPGCILIKRGLKNTPMYEQVVNAGVRAELLLRKVEDVVEFIDEAPELVENPGEAEEAPELVDEREEKPEKAEEAEETEKADAAGDQETYLKTKLHYEKDALLTEQKDGVMMSWETKLMKKGCDSLFLRAEPQANILNIGFGMGIIDGMINERNPAKHYICEAHPDVLAKMRQDGWYDKPNVVVLEGRWQDTLDKLLSSGQVYFDGIYYDTFSEHYEDMLALFDCVVGLLKPSGVFSFFNGLGADRQVIYDVYRNLVQMDLANYGINCQFENVPVESSTLRDGSVWDDVKQSYWSCPVYYHPIATFMDF